MKYIPTIFFLLFSVFFFSCNSDKQDLKESEKENKEILRLEVGIDVNLNADGDATCKNPITNIELEKILEKIESNFLDDNKIETAKKLTLENCLTVYQITSILNSLDENTRMEFVRFAYGRTSEKYLFYKLKAMINEKEYAQFESLYGEKIPESSKTDSSCIQSDVSSEDLEKMIALISEGFLDRDKIKIAKQQLSTRCITVDQLIEILENLSMSDEQIIFAKFAYNRVVNKSEFCKVKQGIEFKPAHGKITKFCQQKGVECKPSFMERMENIFN